MSIGDGFHASVISAFRYVIGGKIRAANRNQTLDFDFETGMWLEATPSIFHPFAKTENAASVGRTRWGCDSYSHHGCRQSMGNHLLWIKVATAAQGVPKKMDESPCIAPVTVVIYIRLRSL